MFPLQNHSNTIPMEFARRASFLRTPAEKGNLDPTDFSDAGKYGVVRTSRSPAWRISGLYLCLSRFLSLRTLRRYSRHTALCVCLLCPAIPALGFLRTEK